jgi:hypothetical protein
MRMSDRAHVSVGSVSAGSLALDLALGTSLVFTDHTTDHTTPQRAASCELPTIALPCGFGRLAQLGEHLPYKQGVTGSIPVPPTTESPVKAGLSFRLRRRPQAGAALRAAFARPNGQRAD